MVGLLVIVAWCLVVVRVVRLRIDRAVMGLSVANGVDVVRIHCVVIMGVLVGSGFVTHMVISGDAVRMSLVMALVIAMVALVIAVVAV